jgi:hypothetical protein
VLLDFRGHGEAVTSLPAPSPTSHLRLFGGASENVYSRLEGVGKVLGIVVPAFIALRAVLAAVNVVQSAYNAVQAITNAHMAANPVGLVIVAIAALTAGFVLVYNTLTLFYDAVNSAFVVHQELWSWLSGTLALQQIQHRA